MNLTTTGADNLPAGRRRALASPAWTWRPFPWILAAARRTRKTSNRTSAGERKLRRQRGARQFVWHPPGRCG
jgi:hypothetical protein